LAFPAEQILEVRAAHFLFALDNELHIDRQLAPFRQQALDCLDLHEHLAFVVAGPAPFDLVVRDRGDEGRRVPLVEGIHRLNVVVAIDKDGGSVLTGTGPLAVNGGAASPSRIGRAGGDDGDGLETGVAEQAGAELGRGRHIPGVAGLCGNGGYAQPVHQGADDALLGPAHVTGKG